MAKFRTALGRAWLRQDLDLNDLGGFVRWTPNGAPNVQARRWLSVAGWGLRAVVVRKLVVNDG